MASRDEAQAAADERAREWAEAWFAKLGRSPVQCAMFCAAYLRSLGRQDAAAAICQGLEPHISALAADDPMSAVNLALVLANHAKEQHDVRRVERLSQWSVEVADALVAVGDARRAPCARLRAGALSNLGLVAQLRGDTAGNEVALGEAMRSAERAEDLALVAALRANEAHIAGKGGDFERALALARQASALMLRSPTPHKGWEPLAQEAFTLNRLAEHDPALATLQRAAALLRLDHHPARGRMTLAIAEADILKHRGRIDEAWAMLQQYFGVLGEHPKLAAYLRFNLLEMFDFHRPLRPALQHEIDMLLAAMNAGHVPGDGSAPPLPTAQALRERRGHCRTAGLL
jgi:tetratricopeptide (TPR) repeat protein